MTRSSPIPPSSDPEEQRLREQWHATKEAATKPESTEMDRNAYLLANARLSAYLWNRVETAIAEDRKKHPKAKRNLPVPSKEDVESGRVLP